METSKPSRRQTKRNPPSTHTQKAKPKRVYRPVQAVSPPSALVVKEKALKKKYNTYGFDPRTQQVLPFTNAQHPSSMSTVLAMPIFGNLPAVQNAIIGFVGQLRQFGYALTPQQAAYPFYLINYIYILAYKAMTAQQLTVTELPLGLLHFIQALMPTEVRYKGTGRVAYYWDIPPTSSEIAAISTYGSIQYNLGVVGAESAATLSYNSILSPGPYTPDGGVLAWNAMIAFLSDPRVGSAMLKLVKIGQETSSKSDCSAFSVVYTDLGDPITVGGFTNEIYSSVKVRAPIFSCLATYDGYEMPIVESKVFGGTPRWLGSRLLTMSDERRLYNKFKPIFKPVDFNDLWASFNYQLGTAIELAKDQNLTTNIVVPCPLTAKQTALILRAAISSINNVAATSDCASSIYGFSPLQFHPACSNVSVTVKDWTLPFYFLENLKSLAGLAIPIPTKQSNQMYTFMPVYGVYDVINDYNYTYGSGSPIYAFDPEQDVEFNMVTLLTVNGNWIAPVGEALMSAITLWNEWIKQFSVCMNLATFSSAMNSPALWVINQTRYTFINQDEARPQNPATITANRTRSKNYTPVLTFRERLKTIKTVTPTQAVYEQEYAFSSNIPFEEDVFAMTNNWVLPKWRSPNPYSKINLSKIQAQFFEPNTINSSSGVGSNNEPTYPSLSLKWVALGVQATHQASTPPHQYVATLLEADKNGHGGFLSQMIADFAAEALDMPMLSKLGTILPF